MSDLQIWPALLGGGLIGLAAALLLFSQGRIAGVSGILNGVFAWQKGDISWRLAFVIGMVLGGFVYAQFAPVAFELKSSWPVTILAGLLVGSGTKLGNGCTSGHGVCGIARFSGRSIVATMTFITVAIATVFAVSRLGGSS